MDCVEADATCVMLSLRPRAGCGVDAAQLTAADGRALKHPSRARRQGHDGDIRHTGRAGEGDHAPRGRHQGDRRAEDSSWPRSRISTKQLARLQASLSDARAPCRDARDARAAEARLSVCAAPRRFRHFLRPRPGRRAGGGRPRPANSLLLRPGRGPRRRRRLRATGADGYSPPRSPSCAPRRRAGRARLTSSLPQFRVTDRPAAQKIGGKRGGGGRRNNASAPRQAGGIPETVDATTRPPKSGDCEDRPLPARAGGCRGERPCARGEEFPKSDGGQAGRRLWLRGPPPR